MRAGQGSLAKTDEIDRLVIEVVFAEQKRRDATHISAYFD